MQHKRFGVPFVVWGVLCCVLAVLWIIVWPSEQAATAQGLRFVILRWFHALVWLLLAAAAFLAASTAPGHVARSVAFASLITYLIFMATFLTA